MLANLLLAAVLPLGSYAAVAKRTPGPAFSYAGATTTAAWPPPGATNTAVDTYFPGATEVGYAGPTPTGDEAEAIATAPSFPKVKSTYPIVQPNTTDNKESFDISRYWGNLSPFYSVDSFGLPDASPLIPEGCAINQVHILMRHGARYPTGNSGPPQFAAKVHTAANNGSGFEATGPLAFLNSWTYKLGAEILTPFGREQVFNNGVGFRVRYGELLKGFVDLPVFRTTSEDRMVDSALTFAAGFFGVRTFQEDYHQEIIVEGSGFNNTLAPYEICNNANVYAIASYGTIKTSEWAKIYLQRALERLSPEAKGLDLTVTDLINMQALCAYETVALGYSSFCGLFTEEEWKGYEYLNDLSFWYNNGPGQPTASGLGLGYVQELASRLTQTPITEWNSTTNSTLNSNNITFPLNQPIYVDATHDGVITNILTALNFTVLAKNGPLPTDHIPGNHSYIASQIAPFAGNLVAQVLSCPAAENPTHIRFILNDGVLPMTGVGACPEDKNGLCPLPTFISALHQRIGDIDFKYDCFANYTIPEPDNIIDGRFPAWLKK